MNRDLPPQPEDKKIVRILRGSVASAVCAALLFGSVTPAQADDLDDLRKELTASISEQADAVEYASGELTSANAALETALADLSAAEAELELAEAERIESQALDDQRAEELAIAEHKLEQAEAEVAAAQAALDSVEARTNEEIVVITQQNAPLLQLALLVTDATAAELSQRAQLSTTLFDSSALQLDELQERRLQLDAAKAKADEARVAAVESRQAAADQLADSVAKEELADALRDEVAQLAVARDSAAAEAANQLTLEEGRQADLESESADVDRRIAERIAAQEAAAEAARKAEEEAAAKKAAAAQASAAAAQESSSSSATAGSSSSSTASGATATSPSNSSSFLIPVSGRLSSAYGMRLHPTLGYYKLHDGTDFAASCGTPIKAAASGTVSERYYNAAYGNRLMIDHGKVDGKYVTTGYNHATRYVVSVGQKVTKGQTIGYVGSTGYSTGCHLHLMVWENGSTVDPMSKWFS